MKLIFSLAFICIFFKVFSQSTSSKGPADRFRKDTLLTIEANPAAGFAHEYLLFIPKGTVKGKQIFLLVEPNNTGFTSDSIAKHKEAAILLASKSSVGNNVSTQLRIPFLVPIFPRPAAQNLIYTHALDRDVIFTQEKGLERLDLQLLAMIEDARPRLRELDVLVEEKVLMTGFSASGSFVNRFAFLHPQVLKAVATGGLNGILMLPLKQLNGRELNYPLGINDLKQITGEETDLTVYKKIPQFIYMGALDDNDAVPYDDAYNDVEREIIYATVGKEMQPLRWEKIQQIYREEGINAEFRTYEGVGHWTTGEMNLEVIRFMVKQISAEGKK